MTRKTKNIIRWVPSVLVALPIVMSASFKLSEAPFIIERFTQLGLIQYVKLLAGMEILFITLFLYPRTMKMGFLCLTAYFGGAMATEMVAGSAMIAPTVILTLVWIAAYLRKPSLFRSESKRYDRAHSHPEIR